MKDGTGVLCRSRFSESDTKVKKRILVIFAICLFFHACALLSRQTPSSPLPDTVWNRPIKEAFDPAHWVTRPSGNTITVVGIAGRKRNQDEAINDALADAARRVSLYYGVYGETTTILMDGNNLLDFYVSTSYSLDIHDAAESYIDALTFDKDNDVYEKNGAVYVRTRYTGVQEVPPYKSEVSGGKPVWVEKYMADIPGFLVGVGMSKNKGSPQKTYIGSYENALASLISDLSSEIETSSVDMPGRGRVSQSVARSKGTLSSVMILETWFDKKNGAVWTLLVAKAG